MKTQVHTNSIEAFHSLPVAGWMQPKEALIISKFTHEQIKLTRKQLALLTGLELSCVCGRVNSLMTKHALVSRGTTKDPMTGKSQELVGLPVSDQGSLFGLVA